MHWLRNQYPRVFKKTSAQFTLIPRWQCIYRCFDLRDIPANTQRQALQLKINQWSPWPQPSTNIVWQNNHAQVWCWKTDDDAGKNNKCLAETRYYPHPETGLQLLGYDQGYEAQYWRQGILKDSHWWPKSPSIMEWQNFQRAAGLEAQANLPAAETQKQSQPWGKDYKLEQNALLISLEPLLWKALPLLVAFFLSWQSAQIYRLKQDINAQQQQQQELSRQIEPILKIRGEIQQDQYFLDPIVGLWNAPRQLQLMDQIIAKLPNPANMKIMSWEYQPNALRFTLQTDNPDPSLFVKTYSELAWGKDVSAQPNAKTGQITITIRFQTHAGA